VSLETSIGRFFRITEQMSARLVGLAIYFGRAAASLIQCTANPDLSHFTTRLQKRFSIAALGIASPPSLGWVLGNIAAAS
jgi:hypothetical protein